MLSIPRRRALLGVLIAVICGAGSIGTKAAIAKRAHAGATISYLTPPFAVPPDSKALAKFEKNTGITVEVRNTPLTQMATKIQVATATHRAPADVIWLTPESPSTVVAAGDLMPLDSLVAKTPGLNKSDIQQLDFWRYNGSLYGINGYVQLVMMDFDAKRLKRAGFSSPPTTWNQLHQEALAIKRKHVDTYPISMSIVDWSWYILAQSMTGTPLFDQHDNPTFTARNSVGRKALKTLVQWYREGLISPSLLSSPEPHASYEGGVGTFHQSWEGALSVMNNPKISKHAPNVRYMLIPEHHFTWTFPGGIGISKYSPNQDAAWKFIQWFVSPAQQKAIYNSYGLFPSRTSVQHALNRAHQIEGYGVVKQQARYVHELPRYVKWWGAFTTYVSDQLRQAAAKTESPDTAIDNIASKWKSLRSQYGG